MNANAKGMKIIAKTLNVNAIIMEKNVMKCVNVKIAKMTFKKKLLQINIAIAIIIVHKIKNVHVLKTKSIVLSIVIVLLAIGRKLKFNNQ